MKYAYTLGNHDRQGNLNGEQIMDLDMSNPFSYSQKSTGIRGISNYWLPIYSSIEKDRVATSLWVLDTNAYGNNICFLKEYLFKHLNYHTLYVFAI